MKLQLFISHSGGYDATIPVQVHDDWPEFRAVRTGLFFLAFSPASRLCRYVLTASAISNLMLDDLRAPAIEANGKKNFASENFCATGPRICLWSFCCRPHVCVRFSHSTLFYYLIVMFCSHFCSAADPYAWSATRGCNWQMK